MTKMQNTSALTRVMEDPTWALAKAISVITSPAVLSFVTIYLMVININDPRFFNWALVYAGAGLLLPLVYLVYLMRKGEVSDFHMRERAERIKPMTFILVTFSSLSLIFYFGNAPYILQIFTYVGALQAVVMLLITLKWKISGHGAGAAAFALLLWALYGAAAAPAFLFIPVVIWARVYTDRHDLPQTIVGAIAGFALMGLAVGLVFARCPGTLACF
jgi:hypothetical protein